MRTPLLLAIALVLTGCPEKKEAPPTPAAAPAPEKPAPAAVKVAGCYQWQVEGEDPHQLRISAKGEGEDYTGKYLGWEGVDFVAWFQVSLPKVKVVGETVTFGFMMRDLWGDPIGMDDDLSGKESDGFSRNGWVYEGKVDEKGITFICAAEGAEEHCTAESGLFARVDDKVCGPAPTLP